MSCLNYLVFICGENSRQKTDRSIQKRLMVDAENNYLPVRTALTDPHRVEQLNHYLAGAASLRESGTECATSPRPAYAFGETRVDS